MTILIDTQVLIWLCDDSSQLGPAAKQLLESAGNQVLVSYFSFFEIAIKAGIGKMTYNDSVFDDLPKMGLELVQARREQLKVYKIYNPHNKDPFDNMLLAVAKAERCAFITSDETILTNPTAGIKLINAKL